MTGLHQQTIHRIESGMMQMTIHYLDLFSSALRIRPVDLLPQKMSKDDYRTVEGTAVKVIRWPDVGKIEADEVGDVPVVSTRLESTTLLATRVVDDSLAPDLMSDDIAIFDYSDQSLKDGGMYVVKINGLTTIRRYRNVGLIRFEGTSGRHLIREDDDIKVIGRVREKIRTL
jgi:phage repressor protein C with HTH and peptisase S24 domain